MMLNLGLTDSVVGVAQLAEHRVVASVAAGSNPVTHPILNPHPMSP